MIVKGWDLWIVSSRKSHIFKKLGIPASIIKNSEIRVGVMCERVKNYSRLWKRMLKLIKILHLANQSKLCMQAPAVNTSCCDLLLINAHRLWLKKARSLTILINLTRCEENIYIFWFTQNLHQTCCCFCLLHDIVWSLALVLLWKPQLWDCSCSYRGLKG